MTWSGASSGEHFVASNPPTVIPRRLFTSGFSTFQVGNWINGNAWSATIYGMDKANNRLFLRDGSGPGFGQSDNWGVTNSNGMGLPANTVNSDISGVVAFGSFIYAIYKDTGTGRFGVYRAAAVSAGSPLTWSGQLLTLPAGVTSMATALCIYAGVTAIMVAEYGDPVGGPQLYRSTNGTAWTSVYGPVAGTRHCHAIAEDPYNPGTWYATFGDGGATLSVARSTNDGVTWAPILTSTVEFQAVQISFSANWVWFAGDRPGQTVWVMNRLTLTPYLAARNSHMLIAPPDGAAARLITDLATTNANQTITSPAQAQFTQSDVGRTLRPTAQIPSNAWISAVTNATTATMGVAATGTASGLTTWIGGDRYRYQALNGAVDPATEIFYSAVTDGSAGGTKTGVFILPEVGSDIQLFENVDFTDRGGTGGPVFIGGGFLFAAGYKHSLISATTLNF